ncbi:RuvC family protein [Calidifontibacillus oryziterrae]|uniref:hypothetical protein n=1 Tax=Calidifontibacillus oryziterrae TaxID=1191699 RepID=UPI00031B756E|nr:hypothetical protein [Calidifontibacillus oryziterrae]
MKVLFCDQSLVQFGYSIFNVSDKRIELITYGVIKLNNKDTYFDRILLIEKRLDDLHKIFNFGKVVIEDFSFEKMFKLLKNYAFYNMHWNIGVIGKELFVNHL